MRRNLKKLLLVPVILLTLVCCKSHKFATSTDTVAGYMMNQFDGTYSVAQFDSICGVENISSNYKEWHKFTYVDFEDRTEIVRYLFIRMLSDDKEVIYTLNEKGDSLVFNKRIVIPGGDD